MRYFDFHTHILFKQLFDENPNINTFISRNDISGVPKLCTDLPNIIQTQIHQSQLAEYGDEVIAGVVLYGLETFLAKEVIPLRKFLKASSQHKLSQQLLDEVAGDDHKTFTQFTLTRTLNAYLNATESFNILDANSFNAPLLKNKVNIFFVVEGCHSLVDTSNKYLPPNKSFPVQEILDNLDILLSKVKVLSVNPTHLQQSNLCNHAFGIQLTGIDPFIPTGNGMEDDGRKVVQGLFDRGICVDVKHMSYKSRLDLMNEIDAGNFQNVQPLLCTHAGFTGMPFAHWPEYMTLKRPASGAIYVEIAKSMQTRNNPKRPGAPAFNGASINLFDEEIAWIVNNDGIIGISLDRRIVGYIDKFDDRPTGLSEIGLVVDREYMSKNEWASLNIPNNKIGKRVSEDDCVTMNDLEESAEMSIPARDEYFFDHILFHLKHYFQVCVNAGIPITKAKNQITFGSDFDGLINPFLNLETVEEMANLKKYIKMNFRFYLDTLKDSRKWAKELDVDEFVEDLFYDNGYEFVKSRF